MRVSLAPPKPDATWKEAFSQAIRGLPGSDPLAQVFFEDREDLRIDLEDGSVREIVCTRTRGLSARTRSRLLYLSNPEPEDASRLVRAITAVRPEHPRTGGSEADLPSGEDLVRDRVTALRGLIRRAACGNPGRVLASWVGFRQQVLIGRPELGLFSEVRSASRIRLEVRIEHRGARAVAVGEKALRSPREAAFDDLADEVVRRADERLAARPASPGETTVVFSPGVGGILLHEIVGHALEADTVLARSSTLAGRAEVIARPEVVVVDDPRRGRASWRIDDEGEEPRATSLVQGGRIGGWISDLRCAMRSGRPSTGHGRRSSFHQSVLPRMGCTFLAPGSLAPDEVVEETSSGILVRRMEAAAVDPAAGVGFFRVTDSDRIRDGHGDGPLEPFLLRVVTERALGSLDRIGHDLAFDTCIGSCLRDGQPLATSVGAPTCRIGMAEVVS